MSEMTENKIEKKIKKWLGCSEKGLPALEEETVLKVSKQIRDHLEQTDYTKGDFNSKKVNLKEIVFYAKRRFLKNEVDSLVESFNSGDMDKLWDLWKMFFRNVYKTLKGTNAIPKDGGLSHLPALDKTTAEEITGRIRNKLPDILKQYKPMKNKRFDQWLHRVVINEKISFLRKKGKTKFLDDKELVLTSNFELPGNSIVEKQKENLLDSAVNHLDSALKHLNKEQRVILNERLSGNSYRDIMSEHFEKRDFKISALRKKAQRAREELASKLCEILWRKQKCPESDGSICEDELCCL